MAMFFIGTFGLDNCLGSVHVSDGGFDQEAEFATAFLDVCDPAFVQHGDGLITIRTVEGVATYGVVGAGDPAFGPSVKAQLLSVRQA